MLKHMVSLDADVIGILCAGEVREGKYFLPPVQLERKMYERVNKALVLMGGKWNKSAKAHVFERDPAGIMENTIRTGEIFDAKKAFQFFPTPEPLAKRMVMMAKVGICDRVLEPSAGTGNILRQFGNGPDKVAIELNHDMTRSLVLCGGSGLFVIQKDFLQCGNELGKFDAIVMNPPFALGQDVKHIRHAMVFLKPGGRLVALCANGPRQQEALRDDMDSWESLPSGTFDDTCVNAALMAYQRQER